MNLDKIYEAYSGKMGPEFQEKTRQRIQWILTHVNPNDSILDIGCSQGIISLLAAEKGATVLGVDIEEASIAYANALLNESYSHLKSKVTFMTCDFMGYNESKLYDTILITEVIEHLKNPSTFLSKVKQFLKPNGTVIISVPFGINEHPDHFSTFYLTNFISLLSEEYKITALHFMGHWMGAVCELNEGTKTPYYYSPAVLEQYDANWHTIDREFVDTIRSLRENLNHANTKYKESLNTYATLKEWQETLQEKYTSISEISRHQTEQLQTANQHYRAAMENYDKLNQWYRTSLEKYDKLNIEHQELHDKYIKTSDTLAITKDTLSKTIEESKNKDISLQKINTQLQSVLQENNQLNEKLKLSSNELLSIYESFDEDLQVLEEVKRILQKMETQNTYLKNENIELRRKLSMITDTKLGKIALKVYRWLKKLKSKV